MNENFYQQCFLTSPLVILVRSIATRKIIDVNPTCCKLFGFTKQEMIGKDSLDLKLVSRDMKAIVEKEMGVSGKVEKLPVTIKLKDGSTFFGNFFAVKSIWEEKPCVIIQILDNTEQKRIENKHKDFTHSISHDLRGYLRRISSFNEILMEEFTDALPQAAKKYLRLIDKNVIEMNRLISGLLSLSNISGQRIKFRNINLSKLVEQIAKQLKSRELDREVEFSIQKEISATANKQLLFTALYNLMENAWKFTASEPNAIIIFGMKEQEGETVYFIQDNGCGFSAEGATHLFEEFQRMENATKVEGTGIGLFTVKRIVDFHGGRVWADSEPNDGATFFFTLNHQIH